VSVKIEAVKLIKDGGWEVEVEKGIEPMVLRNKFVRLIDLSDLGFPIIDYLNTIGADTEGGVVMSDNDGQIAMLDPRTKVSASATIINIDGPGGILLSDNAYHRAGQRMLRVSFIED
jgi:hypothetical protein